jgi:sugar O-acyltransferase (sialic acid O-acetyltransferase NeuD family)
MDNVLILGAGTYGQVYSEYLMESKIFNVVGFLDDNDSKIGLTVNGLKVIDKISNLELFTDSGITAVFIPIGNNDVRLKLFEVSKSLGFKTPAFVHSSVIMHKTVNIGDGVYILPGSMIMPFTKIANYTMISMGVNIAHHVVIDEGCFFSQGVNIGASIHIENKVFAGIASTIMTGVKNIGANTIIGGGTVVIKDLPSNCTAVGVPAKPIKFHSK